MQSRFSLGDRTAAAAAAAAFSPVASTRRRGCVLTLNSAHERRIVEVIIGAYAAYVSRFVELVKPRPTILFAFYPRPTVSPPLY